MVTIVDYAERTSIEGTQFFSLILEGDVHMVQNHKGQFYAMAKKTSVPSNLSEESCQALIGKKVPGGIELQKCEPYEYTDKRTGEVVQRDEQWIYVESQETKDDSVLHEDLTEA